MLLTHCHCDQLFRVRDGEGSGSPAGHQELANTGIPAAVQISVKDLVRAPVQRISPSPFVAQAVFPSGNQSFMATFWVHGQRMELALQFQSPR